MMFSGFQIEFWIVLQIAIDLILVLLILWLLKNMKTNLKQDLSKDTSETVMNMIEPLLTQADHLATTFDSQLREKKQLINKLTEKLDARIISLNLLLNRTEAMDFNSLSDAESNALHVYDQQEAIVRMFEAGKSSSEISTILSLPRGEVDLVLDLKKKLLTID